MKNMNKIPRSILVVTFVLGSWLNLHAQQSEITLLRGGLTQVFTNSLVQGRTTVGKPVIKLASEHINRQEQD